MRTTGKAFALAAAVAVADWTTKRWALANLLPGQPEELVGESVRLSITLNRGVLFGAGMTADWLWLAGALSLAAVLGLGWLIRHVPETEWPTVTGLALILGGALGNLWDRLRHADGVVDFISVGLGEVHVGIFNVADMGIAAGTLLLVGVLVGRRTER